MPYSHVQPSHLLMEEITRNGPWAEKLTDWQRFQVQPLAWYIEMLMGLGFRVDAWETTYYFVLQGEDPVLEWVKGTSLQPILNRLDDAEASTGVAFEISRSEKCNPTSSDCNPHVHRV